MKNCSLTSAVCLCFFGLVGRIEAGEKALFHLQAETVEAVEGGPVIIKATLSYEGADRIEIRQDHRHNATIEEADNWRFLAKAFPEAIVTSGSIRGYCREFAPGERCSEFLVAHYTFDIPTGKSKVKVSWSLRRAKDRTGKVIPDPSTWLVINVLPATTENLTSLRDRLIKHVRQRELSEIRSSQLADMVLFTKHRYLLPAAWAMLETRPSTYPVSELIHHIYKLSEPDDAVHKRMVSLVPSLPWNNRINLFSYWRSYKMSLTSKDLRRLMSDPSIWVRVLTYNAFGKQCDKVWVRALFAELREVAKPLPAKQFDELLAALDDDRFQAREKATGTLEGLALRVETQLQHCDQSKLSVEAVRRVQQILAMIAERRTSSPAFLILENLDATVPESRAILHALSMGPPDAWLTKEAKTRLLPKPKAPMSK